MPPSTNPFFFDMENSIFVSSEIATLKRLIVHSPDAGIGKILPSMKDELLYDDIVYLEKMREEYYQYLQVLLWFLDPEVIKNRPKKKKNSTAHDDFFKPNKPSYFQSDKVLDIEYLLIKILKNDDVKNRLVASICAIEQCDFATQHQLLKLEPEKLATVLITGVLQVKNKDKFLFHPLPNFIFTRDIGITIKDHLLLTKPAEEARIRESIITKYIAHYGLFGSNDLLLSDKVIELTENETIFLADKEEQAQNAVTVEGGDVMMIAKSHLLIGVSERTSIRAVEQVINKLFDKALVNKITVVRIPQKRDFMHIDTVFTQVKRDLWILFSNFSKNAIKKSNKKDFAYILSDKEEQKELENLITITQFTRLPKEKDDYKVVVSKKLKYLEDLFKQISIEDYGCTKCEMVYSAGGEFPYSEREQWTDACNFLTLKEGVIIGYDRNVLTTEQFRAKGFEILHAHEFLQQMESGKTLDEVIVGDTLILLPSSELSRARGGTHCMSMPLQREVIGF